VDDIQYNQPSDLHCARDVSVSFDFLDMLAYISGQQFPSFLGQIRGPKIEKMLFRGNNERDFNHAMSSTS